MGFFSSLLNIADKLTPGHFMDPSQVISKTSGWLGDIAGFTDKTLGGIPGVGELAKFGMSEAEKNEKDPARALQRAALAASLIYGGGALAGGFGAGSAAPAAMEIGAGAGGGLAGGAADFASALGGLEGASFGGSTGSLAGMAGSPLGSMAASAGAGAGAADLMSALGMDPGFPAGDLGTGIAGDASLAGGFGAMGGIDPSVLTTGGGGGLAAGGGSVGTESFVDAMRRYLANVSKLKTAKGGYMPAMRTAAGIYSLMNARKVRKAMAPPNPADLPNLPGYQAGLEAVRRSMASQGYQGSGNMAAALQKYGGDFYNQEVRNRLLAGQGMASGLSGELSGLGLIAAGLGGFGG